MTNLCTHCALCGGQLLVVLPPDMPRTAVFNMSDNDVDDLKRCSCESRTKKGRCGKCRDCRVETHGCACDGAFDAGCFNCTPSEFKREPCPPENFICN